MMAWWLVCCSFVGVWLSGARGQANPNGCVAGSTFNDGDQCQSCTNQCPTIPQSYLVDTCDVDHDIRCTPCTICSPDQIRVSHCGEDVDTMCANTADSILVSLLFPSAGAVYRRAPGTFRSAAIDAVPSFMGLDDNRRMQNVTLSISGSSNVSIAFTVIPDKVYWDKFCRSTGSFTVNNIHLASWVNNQVLDVVKAVLTTHFNIVLSTNRVEITTQNPAFQESDSGSIVSFPYTLEADGVACTTATTQMTDGRIDELLPILKAAHEIFSGSTVLATSPAVLSPIGVSPSSAFNTIESLVASGGVVLNIQEGILVTPVEASSATLLRGDVSASTTISPFQVGSDDTVWGTEEWELVGIILGCVAGSALLLALLWQIYRHCKFGYEQTLFDKMTVRPKVIPTGVSANAFHPHMNHVLSHSNTAMNNEAFRRPSSASTQPLLNTESEVMSDRMSSQADNDNENSLPQTMSSSSMQKRPPPPKSPPPPQPYPGHSEEFSRTLPLSPRSTTSSMKNSPQLQSPQAHVSNRTNNFSLESKSIPPPPATPIPGPPSAPPPAPPPAPSLASPFGPPSVPAFSAPVNPISPPRQIPTIIEDDYSSKADSYAGQVVEHWDRVPDSTSRAWYDYDQDHSNTIDPGFVRHDSIDEAIADDVDTSGLPPQVASAIKQARKASIRAKKQGF